MTIEQIWQYGKEKGEEYYSEWISGAISLEDDPNNILMTFGSNLYNPEKGIMIMVHPVCTKKD